MRIVCLVHQFFPWTWRAGEHAILALDRRGEGESAPDSLAGCGAELVARLRQRCGGSVLHPPSPHYSRTKLAINAG